MSRTSTTPPSTTPQIETPSPGADFRADPLTSEGSIYIHPAAQTWTSTVSDLGGQLTDTLSAASLVVCPDAWQEAALRDEEATQFLASVPASANCVVTSYLANFVFPYGSSLPTDIFVISNHLSDDGTSRSTPQVDVARGAAVQGAMRHADDVPSAGSLFSPPPAKSEQSADAPDKEPSEQFAVPHTIPASLASSMNDVGATSMGRPSHAPPDSDKSTRPGSPSVEPPGTPHSTTEPAMSKRLAPDLHLDIPRHRPSFADSDGVPPAECPWITNERIVKSARLGHLNPRELIFLLDPIPSSIGRDRIDLAAASRSLLSNNLSDTAVADAFCTVFTKKTVLHEAWTNYMRLIVGSGEHGYLAVHDAFWRHWMMLERIADCSDWSKAVKWHYQIQARHASSPRRFVSECWMELGVEDFKEMVAAVAGRS